MKIKLGQRIKFNRFLSREGESPITDGNLLLLKSSIRVYWSVSEDSVTRTGVVVGIRRLSNGRLLFATEDNGSIFRYESSVKALLVSYDLYRVPILIPFENYYVERVGTTPAIINPDTTKK